MSILSSVFFLEQSLLTSVSKLWPDMFFPGLETTLSIVHCEVREDNASAVSGRSLDSQEIIFDGDLDASESAAAAFSLFLKQAPFHVLFPAIMNIGGPYSLDPLKIQDMLLAKLSDSITDCHLTAYLRLVLFWIHQIQSSYRIKPLVELQRLAEICFNLIKNLLSQLLVLKTDSACSRNSGVPFSRLGIQEVVQSIFCHPAVLASLSCPLDCKEELANGDVVGTWDMLISLSRQRVHKLDHHLLNILTTTSEYLLTLCNVQHSVPKDNKSANTELVRAFNAMVQRLLLEAREKFDLCICTKDMMPILPTFYALHALLRFISPFELLELAQWMFNKVDMDDLTVCKTSKISAPSVGFCIAAGAFKTLSGYLELSVTKRVPYNLLWEIEEENININIIEEIYFKVVKFALHCEPDFADICLLEAVNVGYRQKYMQQHSIHPLSLLMSRVIMITPVEVLSHCIYKTSKTKAKLLFLLSETSTLHLSTFGHLFLGILNKDLPHKGNLVEENCGLALSDEDSMMLLPAALTYLNSVFIKFGKQHHSHFGSIPSFYSRILLNGFLHWKIFVSRDIFEEEYGEFLPSSTLELVSLVDGSLLGKSIHMLWYHFALSGVPMKLKKRLKLFDKLFPQSTSHDDLLDCDVDQMDSHSLNQSLNHINRVVAKINFSKILLFLENNQIHSLLKEADDNLKEVPLEMGSNLDSSRTWFINNLVSIWQLVVKKFPLVTNISAKGKSIDSSTLYKYLEVFILNSIFEITKEMHDGLVQLQFIPFLEQLMRSALLYRFEDPTTLSVLRGILTLLSDGKFSRDLYLQLLLAHSQFARTIHSVSKESGCSPIGAFLRPMSGILRSLAIPSTKQAAFGGKHDLETTELYSKQLEVIKLLRILFPVNALQCGFDSGKDFGINLRELHLLLLSSYGATFSEVDLEIYNLMQDIESINGSDSVNIVEMDYVWGNAALKVKNEQAVEQNISLDIMTDAEAVEEHRKSQFRENLSIDPKICASTVLYFPYDATACDEPLSCNLVSSFWVIWVFNFSLLQFFSHF
jgi:nucleolar pre-ribosomal-associated protein 1